jgi:EAL domain-containing protein (putative c-di-GMP-specific phosphodiesterase class I)
MREAFTTLAQWQKFCPRPSPITVSVNVSLRQFHQPDFVEQVIQAVTDSGVRPDTVRLEITESMTIQNVQRSLDVLERLRDFGVRISIDDFGTGYSSLSCLHRLPFDTLKIDRSFVSALSRDSGGRQIIRTILDLAKNLRMEVVAEGAETASQVEELRRMGCNFVQGYFYSRPVDGAAAATLLCH